MNSKTRSRQRRLGESTADGSETPSRRELFDVLSNRRRQCVIQYLRTHEDDSPFELSDLVDHVTAWEADTTTAEISPAQRKRVYNALRQSHLPKLDDVGLLKYDPETNYIRPTDAARDAQRYLERRPGETASWYAYYVGLSVVSIILAGGNWLGTFPFGSISGETVAILVLASFAISALAHTVAQRSSKIRTHKRFTLPNK